jgi:hypothetical protein
MQKMPPPLNSSCRPAPDRHRPRQRQPPHDPRIADDQHHHGHKRGCEHPVDHRRPIERAHRIKSNYAKGCAKQRSNRYRRIEGARRRLRLRLRGQDPAVATASAVASLSTFQVLRSSPYLAAYERARALRTAIADTEPTFHRRESGLDESRCARPADRRLRRPCARDHARHSGHRERTHPPTPPAPVTAGCCRASSRGSRHACCAASAARGRCACACRAA